MKQKEQIIAKIKRLIDRAKANGSTESEIAFALSQARQLMDKHKIEQTDIDASDIKEASSIAGHCLTTPIYMVGLISTIADLFGCKVIINSITDIDDKKEKLVYTSEVVFIGEGNNAEIANYCFIVLQRKLLKARKDYIAYRKQLRFKRLGAKMSRNILTSYGDSFATGWVKGIYDKVKPFVPKPEIDPETGLVKVSKLDAYYKQKTTGFSETKGRDIKGNSGSFLDGLKEGSEVEINLGIDKNESFYKILQ